MLNESFVTSWVKEERVDTSSILDKYIQHLDTRTMQILFPVNDIYDVLMKMTPYRYAGQEFLMMDDACKGCVSTTLLGRVFSFLGNTSQLPTSEVVMYPFKSQDHTEHFIWDFIKSNYFATLSSIASNKQDSSKLCHPCPLRNNGKYIGANNKYPYCVSFQWNTKRVKTSSFQASFMFLIKRENMTMSYKDFNDFEQSFPNDSNFPFSQFDLIRSSTYPILKEIKDTSNQMHTMVSPNNTLVKDVSEFTKKYIAATDDIPMDSSLRWKSSQFERTNHLWMVKPHSRIFISGSSLDSYLKYVDDYNSILNNYDVQKNKKLMPCIGCGSFHEDGAANKKCISLYPYITLLNRPNFATYSPKLVDDQEEQHFFDYEDFNI